ncbi:MAG: hypothetical protein ACE37F_00595 [Nannocystaceae bacterium]|nr:hypothetical protein [bacterium]
MRAALGVLCSVVLVLPSLACSPVLRKVRNDGNSVTYYTAEGGVVIKGGVKSRHSMCVMPPAQGVRMRTGKGDGKIVVKAPKATTVEVGGSGSSDHKVEKLYEQSDASLFMQHSLYRICEMALNGGFDADGKLDPVAYQAAVIDVIEMTRELILAQRDAARLAALTEAVTILKEARVRAETSEEAFAGATVDAMDAAVEVVESIAESIRAGEERCDPDEGDCRGALEKRQPSTE